jgi:hypothetical protein
VRLVRAVSVVASVAAASSAASAHLGHVVTRAERYLKIDASESDTRVVVSLTLGAAEGRRVLEAADEDRSGDVRQAESDAYMREWAEGLRVELPIELDDGPVEVEWTEPFLDPIGRVAEVPVTVELVAHVPTSAREHRLVVRDRMVRREVFDRTDVAFRAHDGAEIVVAGAGATPRGRETTLSYGRTTGGRAPEELGVTLRYPGRAEAPSRAPVLSALVALLAAGAAWAAARWRRSRVRSAS